MRTELARLVAALVAAVVVSACSAPARSPTAEPEPAAVEGDGQRDRAAGPTGVVSLAFAGDMHFQLHLAALLEKGSAGLGPTSRALSAADVAMVNLESAITERGTLEAKELEVPQSRYYFRASAAALDFLAAAGVDVVSMANNHAADYGPVGLADTLRAVRSGPVAVVGVGRDRDAAFAPHSRRCVAPTSPSWPPTHRSARGPAVSGRPGHRPPASPPPARAGRERCSTRCGPRAGMPTSWWSTCTGARSIGPAPLRCSRRPPALWLPPERTCSWAVTPTCCSARGGRTMPTSTTGWATSSGTTTTSPIRVCCDYGSRTARSWATPGCPPRSRSGAGRCR